VYLHQDVLKVKVGDAVKRGDVIGLVGMKGRATGPHLHWGMNWFQMRLDPSLSAATLAPEKG
jgi:murein DD-endopeptidase MepM/ murein hydrolase activator NlpD